MDHRVPRIGLLFSIVCAVLAALTFVYLNEAFEGPSPIGAIAGDPYEVKAKFDDTEVLPTKQPVLVKGVQVGKVTSVDFDQPTATATVTFTVDDEYKPIHRDAKATIGERTLLGDPYINLDPGTAAAGELAAGQEIPGLPSVDFDEALDFLDADGRAHVRSLIGTLRDATRTPGGGARLNATVSELSRTVGELRSLTDALEGQEDEIAGLVRDGSIVLRTLGEREQSIRTISASGRAALEALASSTESLEQGIAELPPLLDTGTRVLAEARPLFEEARPLLQELRRAAPDLTDILADVAPLGGDAVEAISGLAAVPTFRKFLKTVALLEPVAPKLEPAARNLVAALQYAAPRANGLASFFANMASVTAHGDSTGKWARFAILFEPGELLDSPTPAVCEPEDDIPVNAGFCHNAYPPPGDAVDPEPYEPGSYPRIDAYTPPAP
jgi:phospholipid/cholesterol/gamma-HCH transport system substrate-binding protein